MFLRDIHNGIYHYKKLIIIKVIWLMRKRKKVQKHLKKSIFLKNLGLLFNTREKILDNFKSRLFPIKYLDNIPTCQPKPKPATETVVETKPAKRKKIKN